MGRPRNKCGTGSQEPDLRCGMTGTSPSTGLRTGWHVTAKSSIRNWVMLYKSGVYASKVTCLTPGGLPYAETSRLRLIVRLKGEQSTLTVWQESAEGIVGVGNEPLNKRRGLTPPKARTVWRISKTCLRAKRKPTFMEATRLSSYFALATSSEHPVGP